MTELQALGDVVGGALLGRAVEPDAGGVARDGHTHERACLNCGTALVGDYCHDCGQRGHVHRTLVAFGHDLLHGVLHVEGKVWHTLPLLVWRPGELTRRYIDGQRARFVSPIALFLFTVFLMFAVVSSVGVPAEVNNKELRSELSEDAGKAKREAAALQAKRAAAQAAGQSTAAIDREIADVRQEERMLRDMAGRGVIRGSVVRIADDVPEWLAGPLRRAAANPELLLYKVQTNGYKYSWALIPLSLPFLWLLFPFSRRFQAYDHIVFVTYSLSFMTLLVVAASLLNFAGLGAAAGFAMLLPPLHIYRQLRGTYGLRRRSAVWRAAALTLFAFMTIGLFVALLFALGMS